MWASGQIAGSRTSGWPGLETGSAGGDGDAPSPAPAPPEPEEEKGPLETGEDRCLEENPKQNVSVFIP